jgi:hypothetical protein
MTHDFPHLRRELDRWTEADMRLPIWWRDDDAVRPTPELDRLARLSRGAGLPVYLAVIPRDCDPALADYIVDAGCFVPVQHGWSHISYAPQGMKNAEFGAHRPVDVMRDDLRRGRDRMAELFNGATLPMFVPPGNRISPEMVATLPAEGFRTLSTYKPRKAARPAPGLTQNNTHLDPINWRGDRDLVPPEQLERHIVRQLKDRREGRADNAEAYGLLTHHLVHSEAVWDWTAAFLVLLAEAPVTFAAPGLHDEVFTP